MHMTYFVTRVVREVFIQGQTELELQYFDRRPTIIENDISITVKVTLTKYISFKHKSIVNI